MLKYASVFVSLISFLVVASDEFVSSVYTFIFVSIESICSISSLEYPALPFIALLALIFNVPSCCGLVVVIFKPFVSNACTIFPSSSIVLLLSIV